MLLCTGRIIGMYKCEYLARLRSALNGVDEKDAEGLIEYYSDLIADGLENGGGEAFIDSLEPPELVAQNFMREVNGDGAGYLKTDEDRRVVIDNQPPQESSAPNNDSREPEKQEESPPPNEQKPSGAVGFFRAIGCVAFSFVGAIILFVVSVTAASFVISGGFAFVTAFAIIGTHTATALAQLGFSAALIAAGVLLFVAVPHIANWYANTIRQLCRKEAKPALKFEKKRLCAALGLSFVVGVIVFVGAFGAIGFDGDKLAGYDELVVKQVEAETPADAFNLVSDNLDLEIKYSDDGVIRLEYNDDESNPKSFSYENGTATLKSDSLLGNLGMIWKRGIFFTFGTTDYYKATLYLPQEISFDIGVELSNGRILIQEMNFLGLNVSTDNGAVRMNDFRAKSVSLSTDNGAVTLKNVNVDESVSIKSQNGAVTLENVNVDESVTVKTQNGAVHMKNVDAVSITSEADNGTVKLEKCKAGQIHAETKNGAVNVVTIVGDEIKLITNNGSVSGTILGKRDDYRIESQTNNGSNNLFNKSDGSKLLSVRTRNGSVNVSFVE